MRSKGLWIIATVLVVLGLMGGVIGCNSTGGTASPKPTAGVTPTSKTSQTAPTPAQPIKIKWKGQTAYAPTSPFSAGPGHNMPLTGSWGQGELERLWLEKMSGGRLEIEDAPPGTYSNTNDMFDLLQRGVLDVIPHYYGGYSPGIIPETNIEIGMPFAWENPFESYDAYYNWGLFDKFQAIYAEKGVIFYPRASGGGYNIGAASFNIDSVKNVKGKKIRALGIWADWIANLGGSGVNVAPAEMYMALKTGTVDGAIYGIPGLEDWKLKEVWKSYVVKPDPNFVTANFLINKKSFEALPKDLQDLIQNALPQLGWAFPNIYNAQAEYQIAIAQRDYGFKAVTWNDEDTAFARTAGFATWDKVAAASPRCKQLVDIVRAQARALGKIK